MTFFREIRLVEKLHPVDESTASQLGLKVPTLRLWIAQRRIPSVKLGRRRLLRESDLVRLIEANVIPALPTRDAR